MKYRPEIDGLRAIAVVPVILFHAGFEPFSGGFVGVDVFFVISGYLITRIIYSEIIAGQFSITSFYERRARRILPALFLVCLASIPFAYMWMLPIDFKDFSQSLVAVSFFISNILFWKETGYFETATELKPLLHTWSLAIEEQFYILFPPLIVILSIVSRQYLIGFLSIITLTSLSIAEWASVYHPSANFYLLPSRAWELGVGALLALLLGNKRVQNAFVCQVGCFIGLVMIGVAIFTFDQSTRFPSVWALIPVLGTALLIACAGGGELIGRILSLKPIVGIGLISYSAYLWHQPLFAFARIRSPFEPTNELYLLLIAATFLLAFLTWRFVESPFRDKRQVSTKAIAKSMTPIAIGMIAFGVLGHLTDGYRFLAPVFVQSLDQRVIANHGLNKKCEGRFTVSNLCRTSSDPEVIVWGDSYAMHLVDGIISSNKNVKLIQFTKSACGPIIEIAPITKNPKYSHEFARKCLKFNEQVVSFLNNQSTIKYAVISSAFNQYINNDAFILNDERIVETNIKFIAKKIGDTVDFLQKLGIETIVVSPPPSNGSDVGHCLKRRIMVNGDMSVCRINLDDFRNHAENVISLFYILEEMKIRNIDLSELLCNKKYCKVFENETIFYRDSGHFSKEGSAYLGEKYNFMDLFFGTGE